jgi:hypothetical protein
MKSDNSRRRLACAFDFFMTNTRDLREDQNRAAALEESSDEEDAKVKHEELVGIRC